MLVFLIITSAVYPQKKMVKIEGVIEHQIDVPDSLTERVVKRYFFYMEQNSIDYQEAARKIKEVKIIQRDKRFVAELRKGTLYLNRRLNVYPNAKEVVILHHLAKNNGMKSSNSTNPHVKNCKFLITDWTEEMFKRQLVAKTPYEHIVKDLKVRSPLRSKN